jgi:hypothetical protein
MAIEGRSFGEVVRSWQAQLNTLLTHSVTQRPLVPAIGQHATSAHLAFRAAGRISPAPLRTTFGIVYLSIEHLCEPIPLSRASIRLLVTSYKYTLRAQDDTEPVIRWEYVSRVIDPDSRWCRHHVQGPLPVTIGRRTLPLNDLHLPTGPVSLAEVLRFCIVDLGVRPLSDDWDARLQVSAEQASGQVTGT